jgi:two-component system response regulator HydG
MTAFVNTTDLSLEQIVGVSRWADGVRKLIRQIGPTPASVLIIGPSGTGKEVIARAIHALSHRSSCPFVPVDCAAITGTLFESHMFGHVRGAFTGAHHAKAGCFRAADGGTLFLDEIGEMELAMQAKLLRTLQQRVVAPVGAQHEVAVDVRVIAATNRDLAEEVPAGRFREDLYYRLKVIPIHTEPLASHLEDVPVLALHILQKFSTLHGLPLKQLSSDVAHQLMRYHWPGNVRELENTLERVVCSTESETLTSRDFSELESLGETHDACDTRSTIGPPPAIAQDDARLGPSPEALTDWEFHPQFHGRWLRSDEVERELIRRTLEHTFFNQTTAAKLLGLNRMALRRRIRKYDLDTSTSHRGRPSKTG